MATSKNEPKYFIGGLKFGAQVLQYRKARGLGQIELAEKVSELTGVKWQQNKVSRIEAGAGRLFLGDALAIAEALEIPEPFKGIDVSNWYEWIKD